MQHDEVTAIVPEIFGLGAQVRGVETCKIMNYLMMNLNFKFHLKIGDRPYQVVRVSPLPHDQIRVAMLGHMVAEVPWYTKFDFYLGGDTKDYHYPIKPGAATSPIVNAI